MIRTGSMVNTDDVIRPCANINYTVVREEMKNNEPELDQETENPGTINLLEFSQMYKICGVPIINFFVVYIILYCINCIYLECDFKNVLLTTIPVTIIISILTNLKNKSSTSTTIFLIAMSIIALILIYYKKQQNIA